MYAWRGFICQCLFLCVLSVLCAVSLPTGLVFFLLINTLFYVKNKKTYRFLHRISHFLHYSLSSYFYISLLQTIYGNNRQFIALIQFFIGIVIYMKAKETPQIAEGNLIQIIISIVWVFYILGTGMNWVGKVAVSVGGYALLVAGFAGIASVLEGMHYRLWIAVLLLPFFASLWTEMIPSYLEFCLLKMFLIFTLDVFLLTYKYTTALLHLKFNLEITKLHTKLFRFPAIFQQFTINLMLFSLRYSVDLVKITHKKEAENIISELYFSLETLKNTNLIDNLTKSNFIFLQNAILIRPNFDFFLRLYKNTKISFFCWNEGEPPFRIRLQGLEFRKSSISGSEITIIRMKLERDEAKLMVRWLVRMNGVWGAGRLSGNLLREVEGYI